MKVQAVTKELLKERQALSLDDKIALSKERIKEWYEHFEGKVYVAFSGGKDSSVLLHLVRSMYPEVPAVFCDTGLEWPEVKKIIKETENVKILKPEMNFRTIINTYGWVFPSKDVAHTLQYAQQGKEWAINRMNGRKSNGDYDKYKDSVFKRWKYLIDAPFKISDKCCVIMKERPAQKFQKETGLQPMLALMADEGARRRMMYLHSGCNSFDQWHPASRPIMFWTEQDVLKYVVRHNLKIPSVYGDIIDIRGELMTTKERRTGCMFCLIGTQFEAVNKFCRMKESHPQIYKYCIEVLGIGEILKWLGYPLESGGCSTCTEGCIKCGG